MDETNLLEVEKVSFMKKLIKINILEDYYWSKKNDRNKNIIRNHDKYLDCIYFILIKYLN